MGKQNDNKEKPRQSGNAKGKATFDQNGEGNSPKYGQAGEEPKQNGALEEQPFNKQRSKKDN